MSKKLGLLVGRPPFATASYEYLVIPTEGSDDVDALTADLPQEVLRQRIVFNTRGALTFLPGLYRVRYRRVDVVSRSGGWLHRATELEPVDGGYKPVIISPESPVESGKSVDSAAEYYEYEEPPAVDEALLRQLAKATGAGVKYPKRLLATQVATIVKRGEEKHSLVMSIAEAWLWLQDNPAVVRGVLLLPSYKFAVLVAEPVDYEEFREEVLLQASASIKAFNHAYRMSVAFGGEEEE